MKVECTFSLAKTTPGALQYKQTGQDGRDVGEGNDAKLIGTLYVRKAQMKGEPGVMKVTVEY